MSLAKAFSPPLTIQFMQIIPFSREKNRNKKGCNLPTQYVCLEFLLKHPYCLLSQPLQHYVQVNFVGTRQETELGFFFLGCTLGRFWILQGEAIVVIIKQGLLRSWLWQTQNKQCQQYLFTKLLQYAPKILLAIFHLLDRASKKPCTLRSGFVKK